MNPISIISEESTTGSSSDAVAISPPPTVSSMVSPGNVAKWAAKKYALSSMGAAAIGSGIGGTVGVLTGLLIVRSCIRFMDNKVQQLDHAHQSLSKIPWPTLFGSRRSGTTTAVIRAEPNKAVVTMVTTAANDGHNNNNNNATAATIAPTGTPQKQQQQEHNAKMAQDESASEGAADMTKTIVTIPTTTTTTAAAATTTKPKRSSWTRRVGVFVFYLVGGVVGASVGSSLVSTAAVYTVSAIKVIGVIVRVAKGAYWMYEKKPLGATTTTATTTP